MAKNGLFRKPHNMSLPISRGAEKVYIFTGAPVLESLGSVNDGADGDMVGMD